MPRATFERRIRAFIARGSDRGDEAHAHL
jgi:hypothetical protein